jgi:dUTP pyrophosphatase
MNVKRLSPTAKLPRRAHFGDAGLDLFADETLTIAPGAWARVQTGIAIQLPAGTEGQIRPRSGIAAKNGVTVLNSPGTIDAGYRGNVIVLLINHSQTPFFVVKGTAIAQLVISPIIPDAVTEVNELDESDRQARGFGSTEKE